MMRTIAKLVAEPTDNTKRVVFLVQEIFDNGEFIVVCEGGILSEGEECMGFGLLTEALAFAAQEVAQVLIGE